MSKVCSNFASDMKDNIKDILEKYKEEPRKALFVIGMEEVLPDWISIVLHTTYPLFTANERVEIIKDVIYNNRKTFILTSNKIPENAKYLCDVGVCNAGRLYVKND